MSAKVFLAADIPGQVASARHLEIPIGGPGRANLLVVVDGVAVPDLATDEQLGTEDATAVEFFIDTDYKLRDDDVLLDSSAYVTLASIDADDSTAFRLALDATEVVVRTSKVVQLHVSGGVGGDTGLHRIGYQVNLVVMRVG